MEACKFQKEEPKLVVRQCVIILFVVLCRSCRLISNEDDSMVLNIYPIQKLPFAAKKHFDLTRAKPCTSVRTKHWQMQQMQYEARPLRQFTALLLLSSLVAFYTTYLSTDPVQTLLLSWTFSNCFDAIVKYYNVSSRNASSSSVRLILFS